MEAGAPDLFSLVHQCSGQSCQDSQDGDSQDVIALLVR